MAVRHGYGKIAGTDALVFAYDTGDTRNSYLGEPTENLIALAGQNAEIEKSGTSYPYFSANITSLVQSRWASGTNDVITMSFEGKRDYVQGGTGGGNDGYPRMYVYFSDWSWSRSFGTGAYDWTYVSSTGAMPDPTGKSVYFAIYHMNASNPGKSYSRKHQVEFNGHATPFVNGTRSATQGLSDLTGNSTLDLSNVSFDSNAQIVFDGTDDIITVPMENLRPATEITQEVVVYIDNNTVQVFIGSQYGTGSGNSYALWLNAADTLRGGVNVGAGLNNQGVNYPIAINRYYHFVHTYDGSTQKLYANGTEVASWATSGNIVYNTSNTLLAVGNDWNGSGYNAGANIGTHGKQDVTKIYNRALTAAEVK